MKKLIVTLVMLMCIGCGPVNLSPPYARALEESSINVSELNRRCQDNDIVACKAGLEQAAECLELLVVGLHGEVGE